MDIITETTTYYDPDNDTSTNEVDTKNSKSVRKECRSKDGFVDESVELRKRVALEHFERTIAFRGDYGAIMFRKNLHAYSRGLKGASEFRSVVNGIANPQIMREKIVEFFSGAEFEIH